MLLTVFDEISDIVRIQCLQLLKLVADATAQDQMDPGHQLRLAPHVMASFDMFSLLYESLDGFAMGRLIIINRIEGFLFRIGR